MQDPYLNEHRDPCFPRLCEQVARHSLAGWMAAASLAVCTLAQAQSHSSFHSEQAQPLQLTEVAFGLRHPWALAFLPGGDFLVTEREGAMRVVDANGRLGPPLAGLPPVSLGGQGGLLDVVLDRDFERNRRLYFCFSEPDSISSSRASTALAAATLSERRDRLEQVQVVFHQMPRVRSTQHFGCRIAQAHDGSLFLTLGERSIARDQAQRTSNHLGVIVRVKVDGTPHPENPFAHKGGGMPEVWSWGHRNPQGAVVTPDGELWVHEHGPQGGDELNHIRGGANYGWPLVTYGRDFDLGAQAQRQGEGLEQPVHYWKPAIGPSGLAYLQSDRYGSDWQHSFFIGSTLTGAITRLKIANDVVQDESWHQVASGERIRDVREGPDGLLYLLTDGRDGRLLRVEPPAPPEPQPLTQVWGSEPAATESAQPMLPLPAPAASPAIAAPEPDGTPAQAAVPSGPAAPALH